MKYTLLAIVGLIEISASRGQAVTANPTSQLNMYGEGIDARIVEKPYIPESNRKEVYIWENWEEGVIELNDNLKIDDYPFKYEILTETIEIRVADTVKLLGSGEIERFTIKQNSEERLFVNASEYILGGTPMYGVLEVLYRGEKIGLLQKHEPKLIRANYVPQFNAGNREDSFEKKERFFLVKAKRLIKCEKRKKQFIAQFDPYQEEIGRYIKRNKLNPKRVDDLVKLIAYYDELLRA